MKILKILVAAVVGYVGIVLSILVLKFMFGMADVARPSGLRGTDDLNDGMKNAGSWFHEHSGRSDADREKSMNSAGLYHNSETGQYDEDPDRFSSDLDEKYGRIGE